MPSPSGIRHRLRTTLRGLDPGVRVRQLDRVESRLVAIEQRLTEIDGRVNHWTASINELNHVVRDIERRISDAGADLEMAAAVVVSLERAIATDRNPSFTHTTPDPADGSSRVL